MPSLAIAELAGVLRKGGMECQLLDLNVTAYRRLLERETLLAAEEKVRCALKRLMRRRKLSIEEALRSDRLVKSLAAAREIDAIVSATEFIRSPIAVEQPLLIGQALRLLTAGLGLATAPHFPTTMNLRSCFTRFPEGCLDACFEFCSAFDENPFLPEFAKASRIVEATHTKLVGITVAGASQFLPALALAAYLKRLHPQTKIVIGGAYITIIREGLGACKRLFDVVDAFVIFDGEVALSQIAARVHAGMGIGEIDNVIRRCHQGVESTPVSPIPRGVSAIPAFDLLPLDDYFSPGLVLPLRITRGCYWGKCSFCNHPSNALPAIDEFASEAGDATAELMLELRRRHGCERFYIVDSAVSPNILRRMAVRLARQPKPPRWSAWTLLENQYGGELAGTLSQGGCRKLWIGVESGSTAVLAMMKKRQSQRMSESREHMCQVLRNLRDNGIGVHLFFLFGHPGESIQEANQTIDFVRSLHSVVDHRSLTTHLSFFTVSRGSPIAKDPAAFGLAVDDSPHFRASANIAFRVPMESSLNQKEAIEAKYHQALRHAFEDSESLVGIDELPDTFMAGFDLIYADTAAPRRLRELPRSIGRPVYVIGAMISENTLEDISSWLREATNGKMLPALPPMWFLYPATWRLLGLEPPARSIRPKITAALYDVENDVMRSLTPKNLVCSPLRPRLVLDATCG